MKRKVACIVAAGFLVSELGAVAAFAQEPVVYGRRDENVEVRRVSYADLNLAKAAGQKTLMRRVDQAVNSICDANHGTSNLQFDMYDRRCSKEAWGSANPQIAQAISRAEQGLAMVPISIKVASAK